MVKSHVLTLYSRQSRYSCTVQFRFVSQLFVSTCMNFVYRDALSLHKGYTSYSCFKNDSMSWTIYDSKMDSEIIQ